MADNRIYMKCSVCGAELFLGKSYYNGAFYTNYSPDEGSLEEKLNRFYDKHMHLDDDVQFNLLGTNFYIEHECDGLLFNALLKNMYQSRR